MSTKHLTERILEHAHRQPEGTPLSAKGLLHLGNRAAVDQALSRLVRRGQLMRAGRGLYVLPVESRFGKRAPEAEKTVAGVAAQKGERVVASGAMAANALGLTSQVPVRSVFLTSGRGRMLRLGKQELELRHAPGWQLALGDRKAGQAVRALAWLGPEAAADAVPKLRRALSPDERQELVSIAAQTPDWLAGTLAKVAYG
ncbi:MAG: type IV toxin-antitoxin system AbiEi family antitoxin domain-containing protein [Erythrobacter sp.]|nr:type IV toxin-antitoxin system AbiEi family antitoxin domain-containing protein [Erythrobacter sp.]